MNYKWRPYESKRPFDIRAFSALRDVGSLARIHSDDMAVYKLWVPDEPGVYSRSAPLDIGDDHTVEDLKNLAAVLLAAREQS